MFDDTEDYYKVISRDCCSGNCVTTLGSFKLNPLMGRFLQRIKRMNEVMKVGYNDRPTHLGKERLIEFRRIISEEISEVNEIIDNYQNSNETLKDVLDWLGDIVVYACSEAARWGLPIDEGLNAIMNSQDSKLDENGNPIHKDGKFCKGPNYKPPDAELLDIIDSFGPGCDIKIQVSDPNPYLARNRAEDDGVFPNEGDE